MATKKKSGKSAKVALEKIDSDLVQRANKILGEKFNFSIASGDDASAAYLACVSAVASLGRLIGRDDKQITLDLQTILEIR